MHADSTIFVSKVVVCFFFASKTSTRTWKFTLLTSRSQPSGDIIWIFLLAAAFWACMVDANACCLHDFGLTGHRLFRFCFKKLEEYVEIHGIDVLFAAFW